MNCEQCEWIAKQAEYAKDQAVAAEVTLASWRNYASEDHFKKLLHDVKAAWKQVRSVDAVYAHHREYFHPGTENDE